MFRRVSGCWPTGLNSPRARTSTYDSALNVLRRGLEADRFGVVAYVMAQQPNCLPQQCEMLALLRDANNVRVNLQDKPFEALVAKYSPQWTQISRANSAIANPAEAHAARRRRRRCRRATNCRRRPRSRRSAS